MEAYERAISDGADFIGIDVVSTSDGVLICRPDITLDDNTNVASLSQFADRKSTQVRTRVRLYSLHVKHGVLLPNLADHQIKRIRDGLQFAGLSRLRATASIITSDASHQPVQMDCPTRVCRACRLFDRPYFATSDAARM